MDAISGLAAGSGKYEAMGVNGRAARCNNIDEDSAGNLMSESNDDQNEAHYGRATPKYGNVFHRRSLTSPRTKLSKVCQFSADS
jgi:hypothetical protein